MRKYWFIVLGGLVLILMGATHFAEHSAFAGILAILMVPALVWEYWKLRNQRNRRGLRAKQEK